MGKNRKEAEYELIYIELAHLSRNIGPPFPLDVNQLYRYNTQHREKQQNRSIAVPEPSEAKTRKELIDPALKKAGWDVNNSEQVGTEIPVDGTDKQAWAATKKQLDRIARESGIAYNMELPAGISDYALYRPNGEIIAIVEAKRTSIDPRLAQTQAEFYVSQVEKHQSFRPFAFMTNGNDIYFLDAGQANKRLVSGFFSPVDLENLLFIRQHQLPLSQAPINTTITDRLYQQEAIRRVCEAFEQKNRRKALLIMATGTGKTRTVMSLIDLFLRTNQVRHILFVADRDALVQQAITDGFKKNLPSEPYERIFTHTINTTSRLYAVTLQTLSVCFQTFTPAFFDLIIFDEVHRSIFNKWNEVLQYFDARLIGLTATPADFIDRNTFLAFDCENRTPTFLYTYRQAVEDGYLVDYTLYTARTRFQRKGIKGVDLSEEERYALYEQAIDPDELDFEGTDLERTVSNIDTLRKQWQEIMDVCYKDQSGQFPGKTIVFAMTQEHALRLAQAFEEMFPQFPGLARVITYKSDHKGSLIEQFKKENSPRIAITVDLLETGIDIPEVVNLVFMKPVQSRIKLEQMIGRGTRSQAACRFPAWLPDGYKKQFLIIDFWENNFNKPAEEEIAQSLPVLVSLFNTRLKLLGEYLGDKPSPERDTLITRLRAQIAEIPTDSFLVKKVLPDIQHAWEDNFWRYLTADKLEFLRLKVGPLLRYVPGVDVQAATFTSKVERLKLQIVTGKDTEAIIQSIAEDASRLPNFVVEDPQKAAIVNLCLSPQLANASMNELDRVIDVLAEEMKNRRERPNAFITLNLPDFIEMRGYIFLKGGSERIYVEEYKKRVEERILKLIETHPTIAAIDHGEEVSDEQLIDLERALRHDLSNGDLELSEDNIRRAYGMKVGSFLGFLRDLFELGNIPDYQDVVRRQFEAYLEGHRFNGDQILFLRMVQNVFLQRRHLQLLDLYQSPFTRFGNDAIERLFTPEERDDILRFTETLAA
jgi:type I restriction enzyme R subunit